ncbi:MAG: ABC transporter permease, partial [Ignavibacteria bacterium]|nr:ABC transporter permease [Ignavibacteria bacterium]
MNFSESVILAFDSIRVHKLRTFLTLLSISIGVFAIIGAGTLVSSLTGTVDKQLAEIGENTFWIQKMPGVVTGSNWRKYMKRKPITYSQMKELKKMMTYTNQVSGVSYSQGKTVKSGNLSTNPDVVLIGSDVIYFTNMNIVINEGRPFIEEDINQSRNVAIIGNDVSVKIFPNMNPIGRKITIKNQSFEIIGTLEVKGAVMGKSQDNSIYIPITPFLKYFAS